MRHVCVLVLFIAILGSHHADGEKDSIANEVVIPQGDKAIKSVVPAGNDVQVVTQTGNGVQAVAPAKKAGGQKVKAKKRRPKKNCRKVKRKNGTRWICKRRPRKNRKGKKKGKGKGKKKGNEKGNGMC